MTDSTLPLARPARAAGGALGQIDFKSLFLAMSVFMLINTGPFQVMLLPLTGVRASLDIVSFIAAPIVLFGVAKNFGKMLDFTNLSVAVFWAFLIVSMQWSQSVVARDNYLFQAAFLMPLAYGLGLALGQARLKYILLALCVPPIFLYFFFYIDFSDVAQQDEQIVTYQLYAQCYMLAAFSALTMLWITRSYALKGIFLALIFFYLFALLQTGGRGAMLGATLAIGGALFYRYPKMRPLLIFLGVVALAFVYLFFDALLQLAAEVAGEYKLYSIERMVIKVMEPAAEDMGRSGLALAALEIWIDHFLFGTGLGGYPYAAGLGDATGSYPHNMFLEILVEQGLIGFGLFSYFLWMIYGRLRILLNALTLNYATFLIGLLLAAFQNIWVSGHTESASMFWMIMGWVIGLSWEHQNRQQEAEHGGHAHGHATTRTAPVAGF